MKIFKALSVGMYLIAWFQRASADGEISHQEIVEAVTGAASAAGIAIPSITTKPFVPSENYIHDQD